ncbi:hypothetical protein SADUNF_Sadunf06G0213100 [Salix dunnii]|uniref:Uncharacterized protein n=1 Tax=Salix dunnii TaxID=1413687 RepID=A0A835K5R7_9ROSI|nr:hypothetical protein SADUNF_Sadunf06G0213100 [Salix dunnii]
MVKIQLMCLISFMDFPDLVLLPQQAAREMVSILQGQVIETSSFVQNKEASKSSWTIIDKIASTPNGLAFLSEKFKACKSSDDELIVDVTRKLT